MNRPAAGALEVYLHDRRVGALWLTDPQVPSSLAYQYGDDARPISLSLPLREAAYVGVAARNWFANLLPEGQARQRVAEQYGLTIQDDFGLLSAIGRECAGAVSLWPAGENPNANPRGADPVGADLLERWVRGNPRNSLVPGVRQRLSLAGAQDKAAVIANAEGTIELPRAGTPSTHILKPPSARFPGIVELEALAMRLAARVGLPVANVSLLRVADAPCCLLVERFDRHRDEDGSVHRTHQEDFCQVLGIAPEHKYEQDGGPSLAQCADVVRSRLGAGARALAAVLDWAIFNVVIGNADAHGKNIGVLHQRDGAVVLAPFYDLVPTALYDGIDRDVAMAIGGVLVLDDVGGAAWEQLARDCKVQPRLIARRVKEISDAVRDALADEAARLVEEGGSQRVLEAATPIVSARAEALREGAATGPTSTLPMLAAVAPVRGAWGMSL